PRLAPNQGLMQDQWPFRFAASPPTVVRHIPSHEEFRSVIAATQLKVGMVIMHNGKPHRVTNVLHVTPGNWRGMVQTRMVNIETGSNAEHRFGSSDKVEKANMEQHSLQFSYRAADNFHFMHTASYAL